MSNTLIDNNSQRPTVLKFDGHEGCSRLQGIEEE